LKDAKGRAVIRVRLNRLAQGNLGDCKPVGNGLHELRIDFGPGYRIYFAEDGPSLILLVGGDKNSQARDIREAKEYWRDYNA
jgi:putative addiction module killer protein